MFAPPVTAPSRTPAAAEGKGVARTPSRREQERTTIRPGAGWNLGGGAIFPPARRLPLQAKLAVGAIDDPWEREADRVAAQVMRLPAPPSPAPPQISRKCAACEEEDRVQRRSTTGAPPALSDAPPLVHDVLRTPGRPLDTATRAYFEPRFGHDFSTVRVHADADAAASARAVGAQAYTVGGNIAFAAGAFAPASQAGRHLLAHELAHVVQQSAAPPALRRDPTPDADANGGCTITQTLLVDMTDPARSHCITEDDPEFREDYIDNNIVRAQGVAVAGTTWGNLDQNRVPQMKLTYKDGRTLTINVADVPLQLHDPAPLGPRTVRAVQLVQRYELRSDGFIYPMRWAGDTEYVAYGLATNIVSLRANLYQAIEELKLGMSLIEAGATFAAQIGALGGIASLTQHPDELFEPMPRRQREGGEPEGPEPTGTGGGRDPQKLLESKSRTITSDDDPRSVKLSRRTKTKPKTVYEVKKASPDPDTQAEVRVAEHLADEGYDVHFGTGADLTVDGVRMDVKHLRSKSGITSAIDRSRNQSEQVALDGSTIGLTEEEAVTGIRAFEAEAAKRPDKYRRVKMVYVLLGDGRVYIYHRAGPPFATEKIGAGGTGQPR
jgi:hypothetical protein